MGSYKEKNTNKRNIKKYDQMEEKSNEWINEKKRERKIEKNIEWKDEKAFGEKESVDV